MSISINLNLEIIKKSNKVISYVRENLNPTPTSPKKEKKENHHQIKGYEKISISNKLNEIK